jgi:8-oxo-dGTP diphosphatase
MNPVNWSDAPVFGATPPDTSAILRPSAYGIVADGPGKIAVVRTSLGLYLPGGGMEAGEGPIETVVRESQEECGLDVSIGAWVVRAVHLVYSPQDRCHYEKRSTYVDARCSDVRGRGIEPDHELEWLTAREAVEQLAAPTDSWAVSRWLADNATP